MLFFFAIKLRSTIFGVLKCMVMDGLTFGLFTAINYDEVPYSDWGLVKDVSSTASKFETLADITLDGTWVYIFCDGVVMDSPYLQYIKPTLIMPCVNRTVHLYQCGV